METVIKCSQRNSYMTHSEAVFLAMLGDGDPTVRAEPRLSDGEGQNHGTKHRQNDAHMYDNSELKRQIHTQARTENC